MAQKYFLMPRGSLMIISRKGCSKAYLVCNKQTLVFLAYKKPEKKDAFC
jgi:hypothetical protein